MRDFEFKCLGQPVPASRWPVALHPVFFARFQKHRTACLVRLVATATFSSHRQPAEPEDENRNRCDHGEENDPGERRGSAFACTAKNDFETPSRSDGNRAHDLAFRGLCSQGRDPLAVILCDASLYVASPEIGSPVLWFEMEVTLDTA